MNMIDKKKIWVVIAAFNESKRITNVIKDLFNEGYFNIVIVDDGSRDNTYDIISSFQVHALRHIINRGQGAALKTGIDYSLNNGADIIITFDADGQHSSKDIVNLVKPIIEKNALVSLGSRFLDKDSKIPFLRKVLLKGSIFVLYIFYGAKMTDAHNGLRAFSKFAAKKINIKSDRMEHASEIIEEIVKKKIPYVEVFVNIKYNKEVLKKGTGSYFEAIKVLLRMIWRKLNN
jgi:polyprenyl-phospho-N-acetylgalactosaminyl synthase